MERRSFAWAKATQGQRKECCRNSLWHHGKARKGIQICDVLENHDFGRKFIKHFVAISLPAVVHGGVACAVIRGRWYPRPGGYNNKSRVVVSRAKREPTAVRCGREMRCVVCCVYCVCTGCDKIQDKGGSTIGTASWYPLP